MSPAEPQTRHDVVLFDGICNLCNGSVRFILKRDRAARFRFASFQSDSGQRLLREIGMSPDYRESFLLLEPNEGCWRVRQKTDAALSVASRLSQPWPLCAIFRLVPPALRDLVYDWVGRNRYRWFGQRQDCPLPEPEWAGRFLP